MPKGLISWNDENLKCLCDGIAAGLTAREIAERMGYPGGKNAVIGKAYRMGMMIAGRSAAPRGPMFPSYVVAHGDEAICAARSRKYAVRRAVALLNEDRAAGEARYTTAEVEGMVVWSESPREEYRFR